MCTLALYLRQFEDYPLVIAANRDEHFSRPSAAPGILSDKPMILAGKDLVAGGTWLGVNAHGLAAGIVNRRVKAASPIAAPISRGLLCLDTLRAQDAGQVGKRLEREDGSNYQPFVLLVASAEAAFVAFNSGSQIKRVELKAGLHVFSNTSFTDSAGGKLTQAHALFSTAAVSLYAQLKQPAAPLESAVSVLRRVLSAHAPMNGPQEARDSICVHTADYGTVSSSVIFQSRAEKTFYFYHASGPPCHAEFEAVEPLKLL
jgi:uncharacterized protein with NRDE domain